MPSADQVPINSPHSTMLGGSWVVLIAGSTGSALRAVRPPNLHITPVTRRDLVGERDGGNLRWPPRQQCPEPGPMLGAMDLGVADNGERTGHEQAAQIAVTLLADPAKPVLAPTGVLLRNEPNPGREIPPRSEGLWVGNGSGQSSGQYRANARTIIQPQAHLTGSVPGSDHAVEL